MCNSYMWPTCVALLCLILFNNIQHIKLHSLLVLLWEVGRQIIVLGTQLEASLRGTPPPGIGNSQGNCAGRGLGSGRDVAAGPSRDGKAHVGSLGDLGNGSGDGEPDSHEAPPQWWSQWRLNGGLRTSENPQIQKQKYEFWHHFSEQNEKCTSVPVIKNCSVLCAEKFGYNVHMLYVLSRSGCKCAFMRGGSACGLNAVF